MVEHTGLLYTECSPYTTVEQWDNYVRERVRAIVYSDELRKLHVESVLNATLLRTFHLPMLLESTIAFYSIKKKKAEIERKHKQGITEVKMRLAELQL